MQYFTRSTLYSAPTFLPFWVGFSALQRSSIWCPCLSFSFDFALHASGRSGANSSQSGYIDLGKPLEVPSLAPPSEGSVKKLFMPYFLFSRNMTTHQFSCGWGVSRALRFSKNQSAPAEVK